MTHPYFEQVAVVGAGTMGNGIAQVFASRGSQVLLIDANDDALRKGLDNVRASLARVVKKEQLTQAAADAALARIKPSAKIADLGREMLVVEAVSERKDVKAAVFRELDAAASPDTILATNTSSISITEIGAFTRRADRVIGMHFMNPVPVMKLVEVIRGQDTSDQTTRTVMECSEALGKSRV